MKKLVLISVLSFMLVGSLFAGKYDLTVDETNLVLQCINLTPVPNVEAAMPAINLRNKILNQAQNQLSKDIKKKDVSIDLENNEAELLVECMKKAKQTNVATAETTIILIKKIIQQYNTQMNKKIEKPKKMKAPKKAKKSKKKKKK